MASMVPVSTELMSFNPNCSCSSLVGEADPSRHFQWVRSKSYVLPINLPSSIEKLLVHSRV